MSLIHSQQISSVCEEINLKVKRDEAAEKVCILDDKDYDDKRRNAIEYESIVSMLHPLLVNCNCDWYDCVHVFVYGYAGFTLKLQLAAYKRHENNQFNLDSATIIKRRSKLSEVTERQNL